MKIPSRLKALRGLFAAIFAKKNAPGFDLRGPRAIDDTVAPSQIAPEPLAAEPIAPEPIELPLNDTSPIPSRKCPPLPKRPRDCSDVDDSAELDRWIRDTAAYEIAFREWSQWQILRFLPPQYQINRLPIPRLTPDQIADGRPLWKTIEVLESERMERAAQEAIEGEQIQPTDLPQFDQQEK